MQVPTLRNVRIRSTRDAHQIFLGVARNVLPLITRRLDAEERRSIVPGNVYVWEERGNNSEATGLGMERWTDGMGWGPSRVRDEFLFYHQKEELAGDPNNPSTPWALMISMYPSPRSRSMSKSEPLIKQTYSVHVSLPADRARGITRKWHITAYFSQQRLDSLNTVDNIIGVGDVPVPEGLFRSGRAGKGRGRDTDSVLAPGNDLSAVAGSSRVPYAQDHGSFSAFYSKPPDAAKHYLHPTPGSYLPTPSQIMNTKAATGGRQHSLQVPTVEGSSVVRRCQYRDQSPSISPTPPTRSRQNSVSKSRNSSPTTTPTHPASHLVPLEYLRNVSSPRRDPADEQLLRRFSTHSVSSAGLPPYGQNSRPSTPGQLPAAASSGQSAVRHARHDTNGDAKSC